MKKLKHDAYRLVPGKYYDSPKELWGFRSQRGKGPPLRIAQDFLEANIEVLCLDGAVLFKRPPRIIHSLGATHVILQQQWKGHRIHRAYVSVHVGAQDQRVYLVKSRAAPQDVLAKAPKARVQARKAISSALARVRGRGQARIVTAAELMWFPAKRLLHPAWRVRVRCTKPRAEYIVYVNAETGKVIQTYDNLASITGRGRVFLPNPMARDPQFVPLDDQGKLQRPTAESYVKVKLARLDGDGYLDGEHATTQLTKNRVHCPDLDFRRTNERAGFEEISAYYHVDSAVAYLERLGYRGKRRIFDAPLAINARGTTEDDSWYSPGERALTFGLGGVDDAEDGETVLHEFGHALQDAICPDFGQSVQAAAMGEGFGDYFAASYFEANKPARYRPTVMAWDGATFDGNPPCVRRLDSQRTYESFDHAADADEHDNGEIWSAALWEIRRALGRNHADRVIIESHFQLDGFTTFAGGARSILDANHHLFSGTKQTALKSIFRRCGIGPVD